MKLIINSLMFIVLTGFLASCSTKTKTSDADVFGSYIKLKNALVNDKTDQAREYASEMKKQVSEVNTDKMSPDEKNGWAVQSAKLNAELDQIHAANDIKGERAAFSALSNDMLVNLKKYNLARTTAHHDYCPMYNEGKGGHWLSEGKEIKNPYFGEEMMECGADSGEITPAK